jgi:hypothetical protein
MLSHATVMESPLLQRAYDHLMVLEFDSDQNGRLPAWADMVEALAVHWSTARP